MGDFLFNEFALAVERSILGTMRSFRCLISAVFIALVLAGCGPTVQQVDDVSPAQLEQLQAAIADGDSCEALFRLFDQMDESGEGFADAQGELRNVGCFTRGSERTDSDLAAEAPGSPWLGVPGEEVTPSTTCNAAARAAAAELDSDRAESLIAATLDACVTVDEWMSVLAIHPGVMGMVPGYIPQLQDIQLVCYSYMDSAVCQDASRRGLV